MTSIPARHSRGRPSGRGRCRPRRGTRRPRLSEHREAVGVDACARHLGRRIRADRDVSRGSRPGIRQASRARGRRLLRGAAPSPGSSAVCMRRRWPTAGVGSPSRAGPRIPRGRQGNLAPRRGTREIDDPGRPRWRSQCRFIRRRLSPGPRRSSSGCHCRPTLEGHGHPPSSSPRCCSAPRGRAPAPEYRSLGVRSSWATAGTVNVEIHGPICTSLGHFGAQHLQHVEVGPGLLRSIVIPAVQFGSSPSSS